MMAAISWDDFWQTAWPVLAAPLFLLLGYFGTFFTTSRIEQGKYERDQARRTHEWQRQTLIDLQDAIEVAHDLLCEEMADEERDEEEGKPLVFAHGYPQEFSIALARVFRLSSRVADDETRVLTDVWADAVVDLTETTAPGSMDDLADVEVARGKVLHLHIGRLLRTTYS